MALVVAGRLPFLDAPLSSDEAGFLTVAGRADTAPLNLVLHQDYHAVATAGGTTVYLRDGSTGPWSSPPTMSVTPS